MFNIFLDSFIMSSPEQIRQGYNYITSCNFEEFKIYLNQNPTLIFSMWMELVVYAMKNQKLFFCNQITLFVSTLTVKQFFYLFSYVALHIKKHPKNRACFIKYGLREKKEDTSLRCLKECSFLWVMVLILCLNETPMESQYMFFFNMFKHFAPFFIK